MEALVVSESTVLRVFGLSARQGVVVVPAPVLNPITPMARVAQTNPVTTTTTTISPQETQSHPVQKDRRLLVLQDHLHYRHPAVQRLSLQIARFSVLRQPASALRLALQAVTLLSLPAVLQARQLPPLPVPANH